MVWCGIYLVCIHIMMSFLPSKFMFLCFSIAILTPPDTSRHKSLLLRFSGFFSIPLDTQPDKSSQISKLTVCSISAQHLPQYIEVFSRRHFLICRAFILNSSSIPSRSMFLCFYKYLRVNPVLFKLKHLDTSLFFLNPKPYFSLKSFFPSSFWPISSSNQLV